MRFLSKNVPRPDLSFTQVFYTRFAGAELASRTVELSLYNHGVFNPLRGKLRFQKFAEQQNFELFMRCWLLSSFFSVQFNLMYWTFQRRRTSMPTPSLNQN